MTELFTIGIVDSTGRGMEDILIRWEYIQQFLYSHGITRRTITTGEKQFDVSLWEHYGLSEAMEETEMKHVFMNAFFSEHLVFHLIVGFEGDCFANHLIRTNWNQNLEVCANNLVCNEFLYFCQVC